MDLRKLRAYDYHPAFSTMLIDYWRRFDGPAAARELEALVARRPDANAVRITHSYDAWLRDPELYLRRWEELLEICDGLGLRAVACLFNRWHDPARDCGGVYLESLIPGISWAYREGFYADYLRGVCGGHAADGRVALWELCDKPFGAYRDFADEALENRLYEERWLREVYCYARQAGAAPCGIGVREWYDAELMRAVAHCCDVLIRAPYYGAPERTRALMEARLPDAGRPVIVVLDDEGGE